MEAGVDQNKRSPVVLTILTKPPGSDMNRLGRWLLLELRARGWTHRTLAELVGVQRPTVTRWVNGVDVPDTGNVLRLSEALSVPQDTILELIGLGDLSPEPKRPPLAIPPLEVVWVNVLARVVDRDFHDWIRTPVQTFPWTPTRRVEPNDVFYALRLEHDEHAPDLQADDLVIVDPRAPQKDDAFGLVVVEDPLCHRRDKLAELLVNRRDQLMRSLGTDAQLLPDRDVGLTIQPTTERQPGSLRDVIRSCRRETALPAVAERLAASGLLARLLAIDIRLPGGKRDCIAGTRSNTRATCLEPAFKDGPDDCVLRHAQLSGGFLGRQVRSGCHNYLLPSAAHLI